MYIFFLYFKKDILLAKYPSFEKYFVLIYENCFPKHTHSQA